MAHSHPQRIATLLPSATEIVCGPGLTEKLVGVPHECDYPPEVAQLRRVTASAIPAGLSSGDIDCKVRDQLESNNSLYTLDIDLLERLASRPAVINLEPMSLADVFDSIEHLGDIAGIAERATRYVGALRARVAASGRRQCE